MIVVGFPQHLSELLFCDGHFSCSKRGTVWSGLCGALIVVVNAVVLGKTVRSTFVGGPGASSRSVTDTFVVPNVELVCRSYCRRQRCGVGLNCAFDVRRRSWCVKVEVLRTT